MKEVWKDIKNYEGIYQVSNTGKIRSLDRKVWNYIKKGRVLKPHNNGHGYYNVSLKADNSIQKHAYIHVLVAKAFIPNPNNYSQVNHKDFNKQNNCVENLEWVSPLQNKLHYRKSNFCKKVESNRIKRGSNKTVDRILKYKDDVLKNYDNGLNIKEISKVMNIGRDTISNILKIFDRL